MMRSGLDNKRLLSIYGRVARRYDLQHQLLTLNADGRGRVALVDEMVRPRDRVLDCGAGTGSMGILAAQAAGPEGQVVLLDLSAAMLGVSQEKIFGENLRDNMALVGGDMAAMPFDDSSFDCTLSSYSLCPLHDPMVAAAEMCRVTRPGGLIGVAHSTAPQGAVLKWLAEKVESVIWTMPLVSLGCRPISVLPYFLDHGCTLVLERRMGVPLWPFHLFIVRKSAS